MSCGPHHGVGTDGLEERLHFGVARCGDPDHEDARCFVGHSREATEDLGLELLEKVVRVANRGAGSKIEDDNVLRHGERGKIGMASREVAFVDPIPKVGNCRSRRIGWVAHQPVDR